MAQNTAEPTLKDVMKVVSELARKISAIETFITNHGTITADQTEGIVLSIKKMLEGSSQKPTPVDVSSPSVTQPHPPALTQRPVRPARVAATIAITQQSKKGKSVSTPKTTGKPTPMSSDQIKKPEVTRRNSTPPTDDVIATETTASGNTCAATKHAIISNEKNKENIILETEWQKVTKKRSRKRTVIKGIGKLDDTLQTVERLKYIQAWQFKPETTEKNIIDYLNKIHSFDKYYVEKRQIKSNWHAVFIVGFPESLYEKLSAPTSWPAGVKVSNWIFRARASSDGGSQ